MEQQVFLGLRVERINSRYTPYRLYTRTGSYYTLVRLRAHPSILECVKITGVSHIVSSVKGYRQFTDRNGILEVIA